MKFWKALCVVLILVGSMLRAEGVHAEPACYFADGSGSGDDDWRTGWDDPEFELVCEDDGNFNVVTFEQQCGEETSGLPDAVQSVGDYVPRFNVDRPKISCTTTQDTCESTCKSFWTLGLSNYSDQLGFFLAVGGIYAQNRLNEFTLGTAARLAVVRACVSSSSYAAGVAGAWFAGTSTGCAIACNYDQCAYDFEIPK